MSANLCSRMEGSIFGVWYLMRIRLLQEVSRVEKGDRFDVKLMGHCAMILELNRLQVQIVEGELDRPDTFQSQLAGMDGIFIPSDSKFFSFVILYTRSESLMC